jgi:heme O synthase-like polyprenyltransferase
MISPLTYFLAKLFGLVFIFLGVSLFSKPHDFQNTAKEIAKSNAFMTLISLIPLVAGVSLIISHNIWIKNWPVIITVLGWVIFFCGIIRLFFHKHVMQYMAKQAANKSFFVSVGILMFIFGAYLASKGFFGNKFF